MRAKKPIKDGYIDQNGVKVHYEIYGQGKHTILFLPTWAITHSRSYKAQVPYFSEHYQCITYDPRGNGLSDKPTDPHCYRLKDHVSDAIAVLDKTNTKRAILLGYSTSGKVATAVAAFHHERVEALVLVGARNTLAEDFDYMVDNWELDLDSYQGWQQNSLNCWRNHYSNFAEFFFNELFIEPHSTKQIEDSIRWSKQTNGEVLIATTLGTRCDENDLVLDGKAYQSIKCPVLAIHGKDDSIIPAAHSEKLKSLVKHTELVIIPNSGHAPFARIPAKVNILMRDFLSRNNLVGSSLAMHADKLKQKIEEASSNNKTTKPKQILYLSSPIGLGHARRDLAITKALRQIHPDIKIDWLSQDPVTRFLEANNERIHPASSKLANESSHIESEAGEHDLNVFQALRNMDEILIANFMVFQEVVEQHKYDLIIADEAWDVDHYWHEHPELKKTQVAWLTDFVGFIPMPENGERESFLTSDYNEEMIAHVENNQSVRDRSIFVGNQQDIIARSFGADLPNMQDWIPKHFNFCGYILGQHPENFGTKEELRNRLGYQEDEKICVVTVGGSGVGTALIRKILLAYPIAKEKIPELRMVLVTGPRLNPIEFNLPAGVEAHAFVANLDQHLAACDLALVQGGLTTSMELASAGTPFLYFPLKNHFEQNFHVAHRLEQYSAGRRMSFDKNTAEMIAQAMIQELKSPRISKPVESDGAKRAAAMIAELL